jgi:hypothetical protein
MHTCNPSTEEAEEGGSQNPGQPRLHRESLSQENKTKQEKQKRKKEKSAKEDKVARNQDCLGFAPR